MSAPPAARRLGHEECGVRTFRFLVRLAGRRERVTYSDLAFELELGSPRRLGWLLGPLLRWAVAQGLPALPIIVVRRADGLPSGCYDPAEIATETLRVFDHDWNVVPPPSAGDLLPFAVPPRR